MAPSFGRAHSFQPSSPRLGSNIELDDTASTSFLSPINPTTTSTLSPSHAPATTSSNRVRARTRSVGADVGDMTMARSHVSSFDHQEHTSSHKSPAMITNHEEGKEYDERETFLFDRVLGTPDFTLSASDHRYRLPRSPPISDREISGSSAAALHAIGKGASIGNSHGEDSRSRSSSSSNSNSSRASHDITRPKIPTEGSPQRPRFTSQLRSFFSSITNVERIPSSSIAEDKVRSSGEFDEIGGSSSTGRFQGLTASATSLAAEATTMPQRPHPLAMPAARQAGPNGLRGLNDESPPLTPTSEKESDPELYSQHGVSRHHYHAPKHQWSVAQAAADAAAEAAAATGTQVHQDHSMTSYSNAYINASTTTTSSSTASGRSSPVFSNFSVSSSTGTFSPPTRPTSSIAGVKATSFSTTAGLLPSHTISPPTSPAPIQPSSTVAFGLHPSPSSSGVVSLERFVRSTAIKALSMVSMPRLPPFRPHIPALFFLTIAFVGSTLVLLLALSTLPLTLPSHITDLTLSEIRDMSMSLRTYSRSSTHAFLHTLFVLGYFFTWKQAFTVPGSLIMNVVFGAMYGTFVGTLITSVLTSLGGVFCYLLLAPLGPLIGALPGLSKPLNAMRSALALAPSGRAIKATRVERGASNGAMRRRSSRTRPSIRHSPTPSSFSRQTTTPPPPMVRRSSLPSKMAARRSSRKEGTGNIWTYLLVLRVLPIVPYGLMNMACSVLRVPLMPYAFTLLVGSVPWNACTVQVGDLLVEVVSAIGAATMAEGGLADTIDLGGFSDAPPPSLTDPVLAAEKARLASAARKAGGGARGIAAKVWNKEMMVKLALMSIVSLAPMLLQRYIKARSERLAQEQGEVEADGEAEYADEGEEEEAADEALLEADEEGELDLQGSREEGEEEEKEENSCYNYKHGARGEAGVMGARTSMPATLTSSIRAWRSSWNASSLGEDGGRFSSAWSGQGLVSDEEGVGKQHECQGSLSRSGEWIWSNEGSESMVGGGFKAPTIKRASVATTRRI